jgi:putative transposase
MSWPVSIAMNAACSINGIHEDEALARRGRPDIFNTNKGPPFTSIDFTTVLKTGGAAIVIEGC